MSNTEDFDDTINANDNSQTEAIVKESDFYQILELDRNASKEDIKNSYLQKALIYHPDKPTGDREKFKQICLAYKILSNDKKRKEYDQTLSNTFEELKNDDRDTEYHTTDQFLTKDDEGKKKFDVREFQKHFDENRNWEEKKELEELKKRVKKEKQAIKTKTAEELLEEIRKNRETDETLYKPLDSHEPPVNNENKFDPDFFNKMFEDMKRQRQDISLYQPSSDIGDFNSYNSDYLSQMNGMQYDNLFNNFQGGLNQNPNSDFIYTSFDSTDEKPSNNDDKSRYYEDVESRLKSLEEERNRLLYLNKEEYVVDENMSKNPLGNLSEYMEGIDKEILGIEGNQGSLGIEGAQGSLGIEGAQENE